MSYIALEGIEGAGKSTIASELEARLSRQGTEVLRVREPGGTSFGEAIRNLLLETEGHMEGWTEAMLFSAARSQLAAEVIGPALDEGKTVISDRSVYSSLAYQGGGRGLGVDEVRRVNAAGLGDVWPARVLLLRLEARQGLERQQNPDRIGAEGVEFMQRVVEAYDKLAAEEPERFVVIDASESFDSVLVDVLAAVGL